MTVEPAADLAPERRDVGQPGHPAAPDRLALAMGGPGSTFADYGMRWDNSGRNGHYAPISWSN